MSPQVPPEILPAALDLPPFRQRPPWWGADLQTLRDTLRGCRLRNRQALAVPIPIGAGESLLALLDQPLQGAAWALVLICHGLGGSSESEGPRRLAMALRQAGMAVLRLNLRGAGAGRALAAGTYAADCSSDLLPVLRQARGLAAQLAGEGRAPLPLAGAGISLGGTILLNATAAARRQGQPGLDALVCISSPLDLPACSRQFARPRNHLYQRWLVRRLRSQVLSDPHGISTALRQSLSGAQRPRSIRAFDALVTAPRWGHASVDDYYRAASPLSWLSGELTLPPLLLLHAADDPWVPAAAAGALLQRLRAGGADLPAGLEICLPPHGGHNGFHGFGDSPSSCWSDRLTTRWLCRRLAPAPPASG
jgi:predicted alpha/beta-fold hydrolase